MLASPPHTVAHADSDANAAVQTTVPPQAAAEAASLHRSTGLFAPTPLVVSESVALTDEASQLCAAPSLLPASLAPIDPAVAALHPPPSPSAAAAAAADSAKCLASTEASPIALGACPQAHSLTDGRDNREKQNSSPSAAPIGSAQRALLLTANTREQPDNVDESNSSPRLSGPTTMELASDDDAAAPSAAPSADASSSSAAASVPAASSLLPTARPMPPHTTNHVHHSRQAQLSVRGAAVTVLPVDRRSASSTAAPSAAAAKPRKGTLQPGLASMFTAAQRQQIEAAEEAAAAAAASSAAPAAAAASAASSAAAAPSSRPSLMAPSHCLVFNPALFNEQSNDRADHAKALACGPTPADVEAIVVAWQPALQRSMLCAFALDNRVHVQFNTREDLEQAHFSIKTLVPCCVTAAPRSAWQLHARPPCGSPLRNECAERIDIECACSDADKIRDPKWVADTSKAILELVAIDVTTQWIPASQHGNRFLLSVLARGGSVAQLTETVQRINAAGHKFEGQSIRAQAPNVPSLARCKQCSGLGHSSNACTEYRGVALRMLWLQPVNFATASQLKHLSGAQRVYLGHDLNTRAASRKLTLLFDHLDDETPHMEQIGARFGTHVLSIRHLLVDAYIVDLKDRLDECTHCGSMDRAHQCEGGALRWPHVHPRQNARRQPQGERKAAAQPNHAGAAPERDSVCLSWSRNKTCPRQERQEHCRFQHPANFVVKSKQVCFYFRDTGHCARGSACKFVSSHVRPTAVSAAAAAQAQPPSVAASAQAAASSAPAPADSPARRRSSNRNATPTRSQTASAAASAASAQPRSDASEEEKEQAFTVVTHSRRKASTVTPQPAAAPVAAAAPSTKHKRKAAQADLSSPMLTPEQGAAASAKPASSPLPPSLPTPSAHHWADLSDSDGEGPQLTARPANPPLSSLSSLSSPRPASSGTPMNPPKRAHTQGRAPSDAASSSADASNVQRTLSFGSPAASPPAASAAAAASSSPVRRHSDAGKAKNARF